MSTINQTTKYNNTTDFPVLGTEMPQKKSIKGIKLPLDQLGFTSHIDDLRNERQSHSGRHRREDDDRTKAYEQLQDKDAMAERLTKTRLCWSVQKGVVCPHGDGKCKFAHTLEEIALAPCLFGMRCRFVRWSDQTGEYSNSGSKTCGYLHPEETRSNCMCRTGLDQIELKVAKKRTQRVRKTPTKVIGLVPSQAILGAPKKNVWSRTSKITPIKYNKEEIENADTIDILIEEEDDHEVPHGTQIEPATIEFESLLISPEQLLNEDEEATFSVPKELAADALIAAMEEGKTRITICIV